MKATMIRCIHGVTNPNAGSFISTTFHKRGVCAPSVSKERIVADIIRDGDVVALIGDNGEATLTPWANVIDWKPEKPAQKKTEEPQSKGVKA